MSATPENRSLPVTARYGWIAALLVSALASAAEIPIGTHIEIRLTTAVNSTTARVKDPVGAVVIAPVVIDGNIVLAAGTKVKAEIQEVQQPATADDKAMVHIQFDQLAGATGQKAALNGRLVGIDNARETIDDQGRIQGIVASQTGTARLDQGIAKVTEKYPGLGDFLGMAKSAVVKQVDPSIHYEPGVEMTVELTKPLLWRETAPPPAIRAITPADQLAELVNREPARTVAQKPPSPSDTTNIMYIGSREQIEAAFKEAGWSPAANLGKVSEFETFRAMAEDRGYKEGPVSILMLDGRPPDLVFEKVNDTFNARHHLRIWHRPETFHGEDVWVCAATHDIGIAFSDRDRTFIHKVDPEIDKERAKVVSDLLFTGKVQALSLVDRPNAPTTGQNATGDDFKTDGRMAVLEF